MSEHGGRPLRRPRQVTLAGGLALTGCVLLVLSMLDSMSRVRSVDVRDSVSRFLSTPPGSGLGIEVDQVIGVMRGLVFVSGALAAAGAVLAVYVLRRHRGARVGLTVTAVLLVVLATTVSGLLPLVVAVAATMLWSREARDWFEGRAASTPGASDVRPSENPPPGQQPGQQPDRPARPGPWTGEPGQQPWQTPALPPGQPQPPSWAWSGPGPPYASGLAPDRRPATVTVAAVLTWVFCGIALLACALLVVSLLVQQDELVRALRRDRGLASLGLSQAEIVGALWVVGAVGIFWSLAAVALAVLAFRRVNAGRIALVVSAALAGLVGILAVPVGWLNAFAALATVVLLLVGPSQRWFLRRQPPPGPFLGPPSGPPPGWAPAPPPQPPEQPPGGPGGEASPPPSGKPPVW